MMFCFFFFVCLLDSGVVVVIIFFIVHHKCLWCESVFSMDFLLRCATFDALPAQPIPIESHKVFTHSSFLLLLNHDPFGKCAKELKLKQWMKDKKDLQIPNTQRTETTRWKTICTHEIRLRAVAFAGAGVMFMLMMMMMCRYCRCIWFDWWHFFFFALTLLPVFRFMIQIYHSHPFYFSFVFYCSRFFFLHSLFGCIRNSNFFHVPCLQLLFVWWNFKHNVHHIKCGDDAFTNVEFLCIRLIRRPFLLCSSFMMVKWFVYWWMEWDSFFSDDTKSISELQIVNNKP